MDKLNMTLLKLAIKTSGQKKKLKVWLRDRALVLPGLRVIEIAKASRHSFAEVARKAGLAEDVVAAVIQAVDFEGMVQHANKAIINDVLNFVEKEL